MLNPPDAPLQYTRLLSAPAEIRLLSIPRKTLDSDANDRANYTLFHTTLEHTKAYTALSYSWLDPSPQRLIHVNGHPVHVTGSLAKALESFRSADQDLVVWVDALCINQIDSIEKSAQVQLMRQIYKTAAHVVIWLGPSTPQTDCSMQQIRGLGQALMDIGIWTLSSGQLMKWDLASDDNADSVGVKQKILDIVDGYIVRTRNNEHPFWWVMSDLGSRMWFKRVWCIQECANARVATFRCGGEEADFTCYWATAMFCTVFTCRILQNPSGDMEADQSALWLTNILQAFFPTELTGIRRRTLVGKGHTLKALLYMANVVDSSKERVGATDPRDRVYALLGIANDAVAGDMVADYGLSCEDVYIAAARALLKHGHDDILSLCRSRSVCEHLPSWVPDWSALNRKPWSVWHEERMFNACGALERAGALSLISLDEDPASHHAVFEGIFVDTVHELGPPWSVDVDSKFDYDAARKYLDSITLHLSLSDRYIPTQKEEAQWRLAVGDTEVTDLTSQVQRASSDSHMKTGYTMLRRVLDEQAEPEDIQQNRSSYGAFMCQMERTHDSRPFRSRSGYVGICPMEAREGDSVVVLAGARVPYVIRKGSESGHWHLVGESHVIGIMDGEITREGRAIEEMILC